MTNYDTTDERDGNYMVINGVRYPVINSWLDVAPTSDGRRRWSIVTEGQEETGEAEVQPEQPAGATVDHKPYGECGCHARNGEPLRQSGPVARGHLARPDAGTAAPCDCHEHYQQVCDACQGVGGPEPDAGTAVDLSGVDPSWFPRVVATLARDLPRTSMAVWSTVISENAAEMCELMETRRCPTTRGLSDCPPCARFETEADPEQPTIDAVARLMRHGE